METFPNPILGYRVWQVRDGELFSVVASREQPWRSGVNKSACSKEFYAPCLDDHHCGIHAYRNIEDARLYLYRLSLNFSREEFILGAVAGAGVVQLHETGWRAEEVQILGFSHKIDRQSRNYDIDVEQLIENYGLPVFEKRGELARFAETQLKLKHSVV